MLRNTLMGLDELLLEVPDQLERQYLQEAIKCYHIEAYRAAVILAWIVTVRNLEKKLAQLAREDGEANTYWANIEVKRKSGQSYEEDLLDACKALGIFDIHEMEELKHLRDTRNWCAHPTNYEPKAEKVRHCLRSAVEYALARPFVRGFVYIRFLTEESIKDQYFLPSRDPDTVDAHVKEILTKLRTDLHIKLAERMVNTFQDPQATSTTKDNVQQFLSSIVRQSSDTELPDLTEVVKPLLSSDIRAGVVILSSQPDSLSHLSSLEQDRLRAFVVAEAAAGASLDWLMVRALELIIKRGTLTHPEFAQMESGLRQNIYNIYPLLEDKDLAFFVRLLIDRLEQDLSRDDLGREGTIFSKANPAAKFIQKTGLASFDSQSPESRQRLADALAFAACENAYDAIPVFAAPARLSDEWLRLLLNGLAHRFREGGSFFNLKILRRPLLGWVGHGHNLTSDWVSLLQQTVEGFAQRSQLEYSLTVNWCTFSLPKKTEELIETLKEVAQVLGDNGHDNDLIRELVKHLSPDQELSL